ncbi:MAG TPA: DUF350 domain-containing protein [Chloroflexota bacterium]|jgi:uncharacterized membrane protein YjfL (UPF0719 family)
MNPDIERFLLSLGTTVLWSTVAILLVIIVFEALNLKYKLMNEIFQENSIAAAVLAASFVIGIFYTVVQIVIH